MPPVNITWYAPKVRRIMKDVRALKQKDIADIEGITQQAVSKKQKNKTYDAVLTNMIQILDLAGYEIREKEEG
jgi:predicted XRE-type DNA-binding protein